PVSGPVALPPSAFATVAPPAAIVTIAATIPTTAAILFRRITFSPSRFRPEIRRRPERSKPSLIPRPWTFKRPASEEWAALPRRPLTLFWLADSAGDGEEQVF